MKLSFLACYCNLNLKHHFRLAIKSWIRSFISNFLFEFDLEVSFRFRLLLEIKLGSLFQDSNSNSIRIKNWKRSFDYNLLFLVEFEALLPSSYFDSTWKLRSLLFIKSGIWSFVSDLIFGLEFEDSFWKKTRNKVWKVWNKASISNWNKKYETNLQSLIQVRSWKGSFKVELQ